MKTIEVKETSILPNNTDPAGLYIVGGFLYGKGQGLFATQIGNVIDFTFADLSAEATAISSDTLLKAIAISQRPDLAKDLLNKD